MEQTLTLTKEPLKTARLARKADLTVAAKGVLTNETTQTYLSIDTDQQVHAFILEGVGAVQRWLDMIGTEDATNNFGILYFSQDITKAEQDLEWCKPLLQPSCTSSTTSSTSSIPIKKTVRKNVSATKNGRNTTSVQKAAVQKETDTTKSRIATAVPKKIPKPATNTTTRTSTKQPTKAPVTKAPVTKAPVTRTRKPDTGATPSIKSSATKKIPTSKGAGVTKSTPPVATTGRTQKVSRVDKKDAAPEKKKVASKKPEVSRVKKVEETEPSEQDITPPPEVQNELKEEEKVEEIPQEQVEEELMPPTEPVEENLAPPAEPVEENLAPPAEPVEEDLVPPTEPVEEDLIPPTEPVEEKTVDSLSKVDEGVVLEDLKTERIIEHSISHVSSGSSATTDEHDAEVAAAVMTSRKSSGTPSYFDRAQRFSPPRPETPEVDQLRQRFETIIQTPTAKTPSAKISPEFVARIKEMKPKGPAGSRVKSMVELFMDENLNKWEF